MYVLRTRPHESGYFWNRVLFYTNQPSSVHTKPVNRIFWNRSPLWIFFLGSDGFGYWYFVWTTETGYFWRRECSLKWKFSSSKWWTLRWLIVLFATLLALIAILIACILLIWRQQLAISKDRGHNLILIMKSLSTRRRPDGTLSKSLFYVRLTQTSARWDNV